MTRYLSILTIGAALSMTAGLAVAGDTVSASTVAATSGVGRPRPRHGFRQVRWRRPRGEAMR